MIYIKYTLKNDPNHWSIWAHEKGSKTEINILDSKGSTYPYKERLNLKEDKKDWYIKYMKQEELDLLKLEFL